MCLELILNIAFLALIFLNSLIFLNTLDETLAIINYCSRVQITSLYRIYLKIYFSYLSGFKTPFKFVYLER